MLVDMLVFHFDLKNYFYRHICDYSITVKYDENVRHIF